MPRGKPPRDRVGDANGTPNRARWRAGSELRLASREGKADVFPSRRENRANRKAAGALIGEGCRQTASALLKAVSVQSADDAPLPAGSDDFSLPGGPLRIAVGALPT